MNSRLITLTQELIQIDSQNPPGDERAIVAFIERYVKRLGLPYRIYTFKKRRPNLICRLVARQRKKTLLLTPHVDTVPAKGSWRFPPFSGTLYKGKIYGRGATDCKCNVAATLFLLAQLHTRRRALRNLDICCAFTADEETGSEFGIRPLIKKLNPIDYGLVLDADECDIVIAQKGLLHLKVEVKGKQAHGAFPERGRNAVEESIGALAELKKKGFAYTPHPLLKKPTINVGTFHGGDKVNMVPASASFELDIRYVPSLEKEKILSAVHAVLRKHIKQYTLSVSAHQRPIEISKKGVLIKSYSQVLRRHSRLPHFKASFGATVINFLRDEGIEAFATGFGSRGCAHTVNEYVKVDTLIEGARILRDYLLFIDKQCGLS